MRTTIISIMLLIISATLININTYSLLNNFILIIISLLVITITTFILTYLSNSIIIPLIISLIPLIVKANINKQISMINLYTGYYSVIEILKNTIMLLAVILTIFVKIMFERKITKEPMFHIKSVLKNILINSKGITDRKIFILSNTLIALGAFFYMSYIVAIFLKNYLGYYLNGVIISMIFFVVCIFIRIHPLESILIVVASWFSPIIFLSILSDLNEDLIRTRIPSGGIYLGKIKAELRFTKGAINTFEFADSDKNIPIKDKWTWIKNEGEYYFDPLLQENPHVLIVGSSGAGKSTLASIISCGLHDYLHSPILIIDFHGEYPGLIRRIKPFAKLNIINSLENKISLLDVLGGNNIKERSLEVSTIIQRIFNLGHLQRIFLQRIIEETYAIVDERKNSEEKALLEAYNIVLDNAQTDQELRVIRSLEPYIRTLALEFFGTRSIPVNELFNDITVIDLSPLYSEQFKNLYANLILLKIYDNLQMLQSEMKNIKYILIDEAHRIANNDDNVLSKIVAESRKYGIGVIVLTQYPKSISEEIIGNTSLQIILQLREPTNLEYAAKLLAGYQSDNRLDTIKKAIYYLPRFHGVVKDSLIREPLLIDFTRKLGDKNG